jgi:transposase-like protein
MILSWYARGMTMRDIEAHLREVYVMSASRELILKGHRGGRR